MAGVPQPGLGLCLFRPQFLPGTSRPWALWDQGSNMPWNSEGRLVCQGTGEGVTSPLWEAVTATLDIIKRRRVRMGVGTKPQLEEQNISEDFVAHFDSWEN